MNLARTHRLFTASRVLIRTSTPRAYAVSSCTVPIVSAALTPGMWIGSYVRPWDARLPSEATQRFVWWNQLVLGYSDTFFRSSGCTQTLRPASLRRHSQSIYVSRPCLTHAQEGPYLSGNSPCAQCLSTAPKVYHLSIATKEIKVPAPTMTIMSFRGSGNTLPCLVWHSGVPSAHASVLQRAALPILTVSPMPLLTFGLYKLVRGLLRFQCCCDLNTVMQRPRRRARRRMRLL